MLDAAVEVRKDSKMRGNDPEATWKLPWEIHVMVDF